MKNQKGVAFIPVLLGILLFGTITSGLVTFGDGKAEFHKEVLKTGKKEFKVNE